MATPKIPALVQCLAFFLVGACGLASDVNAAESDLSAALPPYQSGEKTLGVIRIHGIHLTMHLIHLWEDNFYNFPLTATNYRKVNHDIRFTDNFVPSWFNGLCAGTEDLSLVSHDAWRTDLLAFNEVYGYDPFAVMVATGGFDEGYANSPGVIIIVNKRNPIAGLTLKQLDGILGTERTGGWRGTKWTTEGARSAKENIRTWGQAGLTGEWADKPIHIYGTDAVQSLWAGTIQKVVFKGGDKWNPAIRELVRADHIKGPSDVQIVSSVGEDPYAIGFGFMRLVKKNPAVKALPLAVTDGGPYIAPTKDTFYQRTYPLVTSIYMYLNRPPGKPLAPRIKAFLSYILSREGQHDVLEDGMFIPLPPDAARAELKKLE